MEHGRALMIGGSDGLPVVQLAGMSNRHGLIAGATGTGKTVTLQVLAEGFSRLGVPVFAADVKGDLSGLAAAGTPHVKIDERLQLLELSDYQQRPAPVVFWDIFGEKGHPVRATVSEMGPLLLANLLQLNETQSGVLYSCFRIADDQGLLLLDLKDLRSMLTWMGENAAALRTTYGQFATTSIGAIQRQLLILEEQGGDAFFGEPALQLEDLLRIDFSGQGVISILDASRLVHRSPRVYATFLLWLLAELFEQLPEVGDPERPRLVFFFDEAHLLFAQASKALQEKIEQVVRLIRSKGVGIYFVTQSPLDIPESVLGQLSLKVQHALRAFTPKDRQAVTTVARSFRANPALDTATVITELGIGEALVSTLDAKGRPLPVMRTLICPPQSRIGFLDDAERAERLSRSQLQGRYEQSLDRHSAYEMLQERAAQSVAAPEERRTKPAVPGASRGRQSVGEAMVKSAARTIGSQIGRELIRGLLGSLFGGRTQKR
jgi:DNA helicase HerA-like ATPase